LLTLVQSQLQSLVVQSSRQNFQHSELRQQGLLLEQLWLTLLHLLLLVQRLL
jgi:hypothetical protein